MKKLFTFSIPSLEQEIKEQHETIKADAIRDFQHFGKQNKPETSEKTLTHYLAPIISRYKKLIAYVENIIQGSFNQTQGEIDYAEGKAKDGEYQTALKNAHHHKGIIEHELQKTPRGPKKKNRKWVFLLVIMAGIIEALFSKDSLQLFVDNILSSALFAIGVALILSFAAHTLAVWLRKAETAEVFKKRVWGTAAGAIATFSFLAFFRLLYWEKIGMTDGNPVIIALGLIFLNLVFFGASIAIVYTALPSHAETEADRKREALEAELEKVTGEIAAMQTKWDEEKEKRSEILSERIARGKYQEHLVKGIALSAEETIQEAYMENMKYRQTPPPVCFNTDVSNLFTKES